MDFNLNVILGAISCLLAKTQSQNNIASSKSLMAKFVLL